MTDKGRLAWVHDNVHVDACFVLAPQFSLLPFAGFVDALRHAADVADRSRQLYCTWSIVTRDGQPAMSSCGAKIDVLRSDTPEDASDYVVVVGGLLPECLDVGDDVFSLLHESRDRGATLVGLCTGGFILAKAGLMTGRKCGVHLAHKPDLESMFPDVEPCTEETFVVDDDIITCPGGTAAIDLATEIISRHFGKARALKGLRAMLVDRHRAAHHLPSRSYERLAMCGNPHIEKAIRLMENNIGSHKKIEALAEEIGVSMSQLDRLFARYAGTSPSRFWRRIRLEHAHWMICNTSRNMASVAAACGFYDGTHFSKHFRRAFGAAPLALRKRNRKVLNLRPTDLSDLVV